MPIFALRPAAAVLGDINLELLDTYSAIRSHPRLVARLALSWEDSTCKILAIAAIASRATRAKLYRTGCAVCVPEPLLL